MGERPRHGFIVILSVQALAGGGISVSLPGKAERTYELQQAADVLTSAWTNVAAFGPLATGQTVVLSHTNTAASQGYYRATVQHLARVKAIPRLRDGRQGGRVGY